MNAPKIKRVRATMVVTTDEGRFETAWNTHQGDTRHQPIDVLLDTFEEVARVAILYGHGDATRQRFEEVEARVKARLAALDKGEA